MAYALGGWVQPGRISVTDMSASCVSAHSPAYQANRFRLWRAGAAMNWECSAADLAAATGIDKNIAWAIVVDAGWPVAVDNTRVNRRARTDTRRLAPCRALRRFDDAPPPVDLAFKLGLAE